MDIKYEWSLGSLVNGSESYEKLVEECSKLYSSQYGRWSQNSPIRPGENIMLSSEKISEWLMNDNSSIYWAKDKERLVGYAIAIQIDVPKYGGFRGLPNWLYMSNIEIKKLLKIYYVLYGDLLTIMHGE